MQEHAACTEARTHVRLRPGSSELHTLSRRQKSSREKLREKFARNFAERTETARARMSSPTYISESFCLPILSNYNAGGSAARAWETSRALTVY